MKKIILVFLLVILVVSCSSNDFSKLGDKKLFEKIKKVNAKVNSYKIDIEAGVSFGTLSVGSLKLSASVDEKNKLAGLKFNMNLFGKKTEKDLEAVLSGNTLYVYEEGKWEKSKGENEYAKQYFSTNLIIEMIELLKQDVKIIKDKKEFIIEQKLSMEEIRKSKFFKSIPLSNSNNYNPEDLQINIKLQYDKKTLYMNSFYIKIDSLDSKGENSNEASIVLKGKYSDHNKKIDVKVPKVK